MLCRSYEGKRKLVITLRELPIEQYTHPIEYNTKYSLPSNQRQHKIRQQFRPPSKQREEEYPPPLPKQNILYEYTDSQKIGRRGSSNSSSTNSSLRSVQKFPQQQKKQIYQQHQKHPIFVEEKQPQQQPLLEEKEEEEKNKINTKTITEPEQEVINEQNGFRIRVEAKDFNDTDFRVYIDSYRVLALDGEHVEDNKNGTVTVKKLNRRWKLAEDVDLHSVRAYLAADGNVEISGDKLLNNKEKQQNIIEEEGEEGEEFGEEEEEKDNHQQYMEIKKKNNNNYQIEDSGRKEEEEEEERIVYQQQQPLFNKEEWKTNNGNEIYFK
uniref:SHSP domain-containing protein n=1 Tax=Meloidogyne incognita TaxID=6306 RepID=A0A914MEC4_MELIC